MISPASTELWQKNLSDLWRTLWERIVPLLADLCFTGKWEFELALYFGTSCPNDIFGRDPMFPQGSLHSEREPTQGKT